VLKGNTACQSIITCLTHLKEIDYIDLGLHTTHPVLADVEILVVALVWIFTKVSCKLKLC